MEAEIQIDGKTVKFRATAAVPRLYRIKFRRDILQDMQAVRKAVEAKKQSEENIPPAMLELFEDMAYIMAKHADKDAVPSSPDEWLEGFNTFSIYEIFPVIQALWAGNTESLANAKKTGAIDREITTPLLLLRAAQLGISIRDLDLLTIGMIDEMYTELSNDQEDYPVLATQEDMDRF